MELWIVVQAMISCAHSCKRQFGSGAAAEPTVEGQRLALLSVLMGLV